MIVPFAVSIPSQLYGEARPTETTQLETRSVTELDSTALDVTALDFSELDLASQRASISENALASLVVIQESGADERPPAVPIRLAPPIQSRENQTQSQDQSDSSESLGEASSRAKSPAAPSNRVETTTPLRGTSTTPLRGTTAPSRSESVAEPAPRVAEVQQPRRQPTSTELQVGASQRTAALANRPEFSNGMNRLLASINQTLQFYRGKRESVHKRSPWGIMHAMIAFESQSEVLVQGRPTNALGWLCWNGPCRSYRLLKSENGKLSVREGPGLQGHEGQFLAMLAQCSVRPENELRVGDERYSVVDVIAYEQATCKPATELTFKLLGLAYYLDSDATWESSDGRKWSIPELIREELKQPVIGAACGGTHRLMGLTYAVLYRKLDGKPVDGQWLRAENFLNEFRDYTFSLQNRDGSFSTNWFEGREARPDLERRIQTTGHILEWLVVHSSDEQLTDPRLVRSVAYLNSVMSKNRRTDWEIGPQGHALHALVLYQARLDELRKNIIASLDESGSNRNDSSSR